MKLGSNYFIPNGKLVFPIFSSLLEKAPFSYSKMSYIQRVVSGPYLVYERFWDPEPIGNEWKSISCT